MHRRSFLASFLALFAWMLPKKPFDPWWFKTAKDFSWEMWIGNETGKNWKGSIESTQHGVVTINFQDIRKAREALEARSFLLHPGTHKIS